MATVPSGTRFIGIATSVDLTERKSAVLNKTTEPFTIEDIASTVGVGATGPQGVQGPAGPLGPVGPAGLNWQGAWVSGTSYVADDAVGYDGASWFCILATSGTTNPDLDTTHWALLASQGAQGPQGVQGPTGPQGATGSSPVKTYSSVEIDNVSPYQVMPYDLNAIIVNGASNKVVLPQSAPIGKTVYVYGFSNAFSFTVRANQAGSALISPNGIASQTSSITVGLNESYLFTSLGSGYWKSEAIAPNLQQTVDSGNTIISGAITTTLQGSYLSILDTNFLGTEIYKDSIRLRKLNLSGDIKNIDLVSPTNIADNRTITLPDASGTLALQNYKSYVAKITHGAGNAAPTAVVLENTIGAVTWNYEEPFNYYLASSGLFTLNKTVVFATSPNSPLMKVGVGTSSANFVGLTTDVDGFANLMIEIRVYA